MEPRALARFAAVRFLQAVPLLLGVVVVNFALIHLAPGDPVAALTGDYPAPDAYVEQVRADFGLDLPMWKQLLLYIQALLRGDLGFSFANRSDVLELILDRAGATLLLMVTAMVIAVIVGIPLGIMSAQKPNSLLDGFATSVGLAGYSLPVFWIGQLLILGFAINLSWFPTGGITPARSSPEGLDYVWSVARHLVLPAIALSFRYIAVNVRITRVSMIEVSKADYITTARAKGLPPRVIRMRHTFRNGLLSLVTVVGYELGFALSGSVLVETVFSWPGLGRLLFTSITARDTPVVVGIFIFISALVIFVNFIVDVLYAILDPRIRY